MPEPKNGTTTESSTSTAKGEARDTIAEAVDQATRQVREAKGAATESAAEESGSADETTTTAETTSADTDSDEEEQTAEEAADDGAREEGEKLLTLEDVDDLKPGELVNLSLKRVHPDARDAVRVMKQQLSRVFQAMAAVRRAGEGQTTEQEPPKPNEKTHTPEELYDMAMEGPEGFAKAMNLYATQSVNSALSERGIDRIIERESEREQDDLVDNAVAIAIKNEYPELKDQSFREAVGTYIGKNEVLARRLERAVDSGDPDAVATLIENVAEKVRQQRYKQTEAARAKAKVARETATANEKGSVAATATTRGTTTVKKGPVPVEDSVSAAIKQIGSNAFR